MHSIPRTIALLSPYSIPYLESEQGKFRRDAQHRVLITRDAAGLLCTHLDWIDATFLDAARVAVLVGESGADYWTFHETLFTSRGQVDKQVALAAAADLGLSPVSLELDMNSEPVAKTIQTSYEIARALNITGTPTYIIGNEIIPGAIGIEELRTRIANMRTCGETQCGG